MSKRHENGGPAFPVPEHQDHRGWQMEQTYGMTLRDWFAGQALVGLSVRREGKCNADDAFNAYLLADAMLAAREAA